MPVFGVGGIECVGGVMDEHPPALVHFVTDFLCDNFLCGLNQDRIGFMQKWDWIGI